MNTASYDYQFDPTGTLSSNRILGERHLISQAAWRDFFIVMPKAAPYFRGENLVVRHIPSGEILQEGVHYLCTHLFHSATLSTAKPVYGSIVIIDKTLTGAVELEYNTIGGRWTLNATQIAALLASNLADPRVTVWEQIVEMPVMFPVIDHEYHLNDLVGMSATNERLQGIEDAILARLGNEGPGGVTAEDLDLHHLVGYRPADAVTGMDPDSDRTLITSQILHLVLANTVGHDLSDHINQTGNVHSLAPADINLGRVNNYGTATLQEAVEGQRNDLYVNPTGLAAALNAFYENFLVPHITGPGSIHGTTKGDVGLPRVPNWGPATPDSALAGLAPDEFISPELLRHVIDRRVMDLLNRHIEEVNAHGVTKTTIGLPNAVNLGLATVEEAQAGDSDSGLLTPRLAAELFNAMFAAQGGAPGGGTTNPELADYYTRAEVNQILNRYLLTNGTAANSLLLEGMTASQVSEIGKFRHYWPALDRPLDTSWTNIGQFRPGLGTDLTQIGDLVIEVYGGDRPTDNNSPVFLVKLNVYDEVELVVEQTSGDHNEAIAFGHHTDQATGAISIYVRATGDRNPLGAMVLSDPFNASTFDPDVLFDEPEGIIYSNGYSFTARETLLSARPGDIAFGASPHSGKAVDFGSLVQNINVARNATEIDVARTTLGNLSEEWRDWLPTSGLGLESRSAVLEDLRGWSYSNVQEALRHNAPTSSLASLVSNSEFASYSFEVEFGSDSEGDKPVGVCIAHTNENGRDYGLYLMRTPGGEISDKIGLLTLAVNFGQADHQNVINPIYQGLKYGDGVEGLVDAHLGQPRSTPYVEGSTDWRDLGPIRVRVTVNGSLVTYQVSDFGGTAYTGAGTAQGTIALNNHSATRRFTKRSCWGVSKFKQAGTWFKVLARPDQMAPYITLSQTQDGQDASTISRWNGSDWVRSDMSVASEYGLSGRLIYSEINSKLYTTRRDGSLRQLNITSNATDGQSVLVY